MTRSNETNPEHLTVAELVERERTATASYPWATGDRRPRSLTPATELLRREGVRGEREEPSARPAPAPRQDDKPARKATAAAGFAALSGLTVAGLIALSPGSTSPEYHAMGNGAADADLDTEAPEVKTSSTQLERADGVDKKQKDNKRSEPAPQADKPAADAPPAAQQQPPAQQAAPPAQAPAGQPQQAPAQQEPAKQPAQQDTDEADGAETEESGDESGDGLTDTVGDVVTGVGDAVDDTTDSAGELLEGALSPVQGTFSGSLAD